MIFRRHPVHGTRTQGAGVVWSGGGECSEILLFIDNISTSYEQMYVLVVSTLLLQSVLLGVAVSPLKRVAVAGATGKVGRLVVNELLSTNYTIVAIARDIAKAKSVLPQSDRIEIVQCDLGNDGQVRKSFANIDQCIWCASGFTNDASWYEKLLAVFKLKVTPTKTLEIEGVNRVASILKVNNEGSTDSNPVFILCSSAGVTRPTWEENKKKRFEGAADIPIVRLNPFNILGLKQLGEEALRTSGVPYTIVRPCGLNNDWPSGRPVLSQGDVAVGRTNKEDLARFLIRLLTEPLASSKTIECFTLPYYQPPKSYNDQLSRMVNDGEVIDDNSLAVQYALLQQLLPGETLAPNKLAMGQTYEQLDKGETGRLGKRKELSCVSILRCCSDQCLQL